MKVELLQHGELAVVIQAIRTCYDSTGKSDSLFMYGKYVLGAHDKELLGRVIASGHLSTIEHLSYTFHISGVSRGLLQELARHRIASLSVKSTRYTLGRLKGKDNVTHENAEDFLVMSGVTEVNTAAIRALKAVQELARLDVPNDQLKYCLPEALKTELIWTINARSLRNFLVLRLAPQAHWEIKALASMVFNMVPSEHSLLFENL